MKPFLVPSVSSPEILRVPPEADSVCCDGGGGALGHPAVYYRFGPDGRAECVYCDRVFIK
jgi:uncharacterized Zn-finger protein